MQQNAHRTSVGEEGVGGGGGDDKNILIYIEFGRTTLTRIFVDAAIFTFLKENG